MGFYDECLLPQLQQKVLGGYSMAASRSDCPERCAPSSARSRQVCSRCVVCGGYEHLRVAWLRTRILPGARVILLEHHLNRMRAGAFDHATNHLITGGGDLLRYRQRDVRAVRGGKRWRQE